MRIDLHTVFTFVDGPTGPFSWAYHAILMLLSFAYILMLLLETADGPNHYDGRASANPTYPQFPTSSQYATIEMALSIPLLVQILVHTALAGYLKATFDELETDYDELGDYFTSPITILLFVWAVFYIITQADPSLVDTEYLGFYHMVDFLRFAQIIQSLKGVPTFFVVNMTYQRVVRVISIPIFIFVCFNIFFGTIFYVVDPCFNQDTCPFYSLPSAVYFSVVTMTTTGYGNQVPQFFLGRIVAFIVMLMGAPYLAIPIAMIDAEFGRSWRELLIKQKEEEKLAESRGQKISTKLVSRENEVLASQNTVPLSKVTTLSLYSTITELAIQTKEELNAGISKLVEGNGESFTVLSDIVIAVSTIQQKVAHFSKCILDISRDSYGNHNSGGALTAGVSQRRKNRISRELFSAHKTNENESHREMADMILALHTELRENPLKSDIRIMLTVPESSVRATIYHWILVACIISSIGLLFWQTLLEFIPHGESSEICQLSVQSYCSNKFSAKSDPGCFVASTLSWSSPVKLSFLCTGPNCFGNDLNYGAPGSNLTCVHSGTSVRPFQSQSELYLLETSFLKRIKFQTIFDVCNRRECSSRTPFIFDANVLWLTLEIVINSVFIVDIGFNAYICKNFLDYVYNMNNVIDVVGLIPFLQEVISSAVQRRNFETRFLVSTPDESFSSMAKVLKVFRLFKIFRRFPEAQIVAGVFYKARNELAFFGLLMLVVGSCLGLILFDVNTGKPCFIGDGSCPKAFIESSAYDDYPPGQRVLVTSSGAVPPIYNGLYGLWFSLVTLCTVGYGDILPQYFFTYLISLVMMVFGSFLFAIPISIISHRFTAGYEEIVHKQQKRQQLLDSIVEGKARIDAIAVLRARRRVSLRTKVFGAAASVLPNRSTRWKHRENQRRLGESNTEESRRRNAFEKIAKEIRNKKKQSVQEEANKRLSSKAIAADYEYYAKQFSLNVKHLCKSIVSRETFVGAQFFDPKRAWDALKSKIKKKPSISTLTESPSSKALMKLKSSLELTTSKKLEHILEDEQRDFVDGPKDTIERPAEPSSNEVAAARTPSKVIKSLNEATLEHSVEDNENDRHSSHSSFSSASIDTHSDPDHHDHSADDNDDGDMSSLCTNSTSSLGRLRKPENNKLPTTESKDSPDSLSDSNDEENRAKEAILLHEAKLQAAKKEMILADKKSAEAFYVHNKNPVVMIRKAIELLDKFVTLHLEHGVDVRGLCGVVDGGDEASREILTQLKAQLIRERRATGAGTTTMSGGAPRAPSKSHASSFIIKTVSKTFGVSAGKPQQVEPPGEDDDYD